MKIEFLRLAESELLEAVDYYNEQLQGLGFNFSQDVLKTLERILQYPEAWPEFSKRSRICRCSKFPFSFIYQVREDLILIIAVMHYRRKPDYWIERE